MVPGVSIFRPESSLVYFNVDKPLDSLIVVSSLFSYRSRRMREALEGFPVIVVRDGVPVDNALRAERLTLDEVNGAARDQGIADLRRVRVGILEPEGKFSFIVDGASAQQQQVSGQRESG